MAANIKQYLYTKGIDEGLDQQFSDADLYCRIKPGITSLFWRVGFRWYTISLAHVQRIFRRVENVYGRLCCGGRNFQIERLVLILLDGTELELYIGDDVKTQAEALLQALKDSHPQIQYGKP